MAEVKIDKRTKEYKDSVAAHGDLNRINGVDPALPPTEPYPGTTQIPVTFSGVLPVHPEKITKDYSKVENNPGFKLCMKCGQDKLKLSEDGKPKRRRIPEACEDCTKEHMHSITCEDGIIRHEDDCKRVTKINRNGDEVYAWVKK